MNRRQSIPEQWLIVDQELELQGLRALRQLPRRTRVLLLRPPKPAVARALGRLTAARGFTILGETERTAARVHTMRELTRARLRRTRLILISPVYATRSHPGWKALPRMRAATLARLANRNAIALGGMDEERFRRVQPLGFVGWAGISAWLKARKGGRSGAIWRNLKRSGAA